MEEKQKQAELWMKKIIIPERWEDIHFENKSNKINIYLNISWCGLVKIKTIE